MFRRMQRTANPPEIIEYGSGPIANSDVAIGPTTASLDVDTTDIAVVGTGASAAQFIPPVAEAAGHLTVFQRTPPWLLDARGRFTLSRAG